MFFNGNEAIISLSIAFCKLQADDGFIASKYKSILPYKLSDIKMDNQYQYCK